MARVFVEFSAFLDPRFRRLGKLSGKSHYDAIGRTADVWRFCIEKNSPVLSDVFVDALTEIDGYAEFMVQADLAERVEPGQVRIKGTAGRIEWLAEARERQKKATEAAREKRKGPLPNQGPKSDPMLDPTSATIPIPVPVPVQKTTTSSELGPLNSKARELLSQVKPDLLESWCETYKDPAWITEQLNAVANWVVANPDKPKKRIGQFLTNCLNRNWRECKPFAGTARPAPAAPTQAAAIVAQMQMREQLELADPVVSA